MIVCHCKGITDRDIRSLVREGTLSTRDMVLVCSAGFDCGSCRPAVELVVRAELEKLEKNDVPLGELAPVV